MEMGRPEALQEEREVAANSKATGNVGFSGLGLEGEGDLEGDDDMVRSGEGEEESKARAVKGRALPALPAAPALPSPKTKPGEWR